MKTQQAAEREEQQRIKNLVLNYDLRDGEEQDGDSSHNPLLPNPNIHNRNAGVEKAAALTYSKPDKSGNNRSGQRARKLQLSDVDWYDSKPTFSHVEHVEHSSPSPEGHLNPAPLPPQEPSASQHIFNASNRGRGRSRGRLTRREVLEAHATLGENANANPSRKK
jgi:regulator of nonsense transcripts 2